MVADCREPLKCKRCGQEILLAERANGSVITVDPVADMRKPGAGGGTIVLAMRGGPTGKLLAEMYAPRTHGPKRNRYTSHHHTCPMKD